MYKQKKKLCSFILAFCMLCLTACGTSGTNTAQSGKTSKEQTIETTSGVVEADQVPDSDGAAYVEVDDNEPDFSKEDMTTKSFETYSQLDDLGRCTEAYANIGRDLMPTQKRGNIGSVKPTGWHTVKYDFVDGKYLYNRCHLIGYQLTAENANKRNLITGTRYMNVDGMLPFENMVADYIKETDNHVLYRVTPIYDGDDLVASGVQMEAQSVEDDGEGISFNVYCYNEQPGVAIDYETGESHLDSEGADRGKTTTETDRTSQTAEEYVLNTNTGKFHKPTCSSVKEAKSKNIKKVKETKETLISEGYEACKRCKP